MVTLSNRSYFVGGRLVLGLGVGIISSQSFPSLKILFLPIGLILVVLQTLCHCIYRKPRQLVLEVSLSVLGK